MSDHPKTASKKAGLPPGALIHLGKKKVDKVVMSVIDYDDSHYSETTFEDPKDCFAYKDNGAMSWINIDGLHDTEVIGSIGKHFDLHPLLLEDVLNTGHRPKIEEFDDCIFLTLRMLGLNKTGNKIISEQVSFVLGKNWLISFQEQQGDIFDSLRERLREGKGQVRHRGIDYLLYRLIDTVVDNYFFITEYIGESVEQIEEKVLKQADQEALSEIQRLKKILINLRKSAAPLREVVSFLQKGDSDLIAEPTLRYLRDVYEHIVQYNETVETQRDMVSGVMDLYLSGVSNRMNKIMQVLTIIATIFIPLTFIAGIYGMNFDYIPELHWHYGYHAVWGVMILIIIGMLIYFRKNKWL